MEFLVFLAPSVSGRQLLRSNIYLLSIVLKFEFLSILNLKLFLEKVSNWPHGMKCDRVA